MKKYDLLTDSVSLYLYAYHNISADETKIDLCSYNCSSLSYGYFAKVLNIFYTMVVTNGGHVCVCGGGGGGGGGTTNVLWGMLVSLGGGVV